MTSTFWDRLLPTLGGDEFCGAALLRTINEHICSKSVPVSLYRWPAPMLFSPALVPFFCGCLLSTPSVTMLLNIQLCIYIHIYMENLGPTLLRCFVCDKCSHTQSTLMMRSVLALAQYYAHLSILLNQLFNIDAHYHSLPGQRCVDISDGLQDTCVLAAFRCRSDGWRLKKELSRIRSSIVRWDEKVSPPREVFQGL